VDDNDGAPKNNLRVLYAVVKRDLLTWPRYPMWLISVTVAQLFWSLIYVGTYSMYTGPSGDSPTLFESFTGTTNYAAFVFLGYIISRFMSGSIWSIAYAMRWEQQMGTLESNFLSPTPPWMFILGTSISHTIESSISAIMVLVLGWLTTGMYLQTSEALPVLVIILLVMGASFGIGLFFAGIVMLYKEVGAIISFFIYLQVAFSGFSFAIAAIPALWRPLAGIFPATWAIDGIRAVLLYHQSLQNLVPIVTNLLTIDLVLIVSGWFLFKRFVRITKQGGGLGAY
jgi:ABC-2 type transport system permease protein